MEVDPGVVANAKIAVASLFGGIMRLSLKPAETILKTVWLLMGCVTCGVYGAPVIVKWWDIPPDPEYVAGFGAALGLVGLSFAQGALKAADKFDLSAWFQRKTGV